MDTTAIIIAIVGAGGFWTLLQFLLSKWLERKSVLKSAVLGLLHDRIYSICHEIIDKGYCTTEEYDNLKHLYEPYDALCGNSTAKRLKVEVDKVEIRKDGK